MIPVIDKVVDLIRRRRKSEWQDFFQAYIAAVRDFFRSSGEKGALVGFGIGIVLVLFFKFVLLMACVVALVYLLLIIIAEP